MAGKLGKHLFALTGPKNPAWERQKRKQNQDIVKSYSGLCTEPIRKKNHYKGAQVRGRREEKKTCLGSRARLKKGGKAVSGLKDKVTAAPLQRVD